MRCMWAIGTVWAVALTLAIGVDGARAEEATSPPAQAPLAAVGDAPPAAEPATGEHDGGALKFAAQSDGRLLSVLQARLSDMPPDLTEPELAERKALLEFYTARAGSPLWLTPEGTFNARATSARAALLAAGDWGLQPMDFLLPARLGTATVFTGSEQQADAELALSLAVLKYARHARGGRILDPTTMLSSYLDRKPQLIDAHVVLERIAAAEDVEVEMTSFHPRHAEFERLRQAWLAARSKGGRKHSAQARRLLANMEQWRWMPADMGEVYVQANIPEFMLRVVKDGEVIHAEKIVVGEISKQTPIFTRPMKKIVFRPLWRVPESIKVRELWPDMLHGGRQMRTFGLQLQTKDGQPLDWRGIDWTTADIRQYEVVQPPGPRSVLGVVKFAFPSQHTVYMHDTQDKYMFAAGTRAFSHGCMRVRNPLLYAEVLLREDKGWDGARIRELATSGPLNNDVVIDKRIPVHMTYFTARSEATGRIVTFRDIYGHERRITQALEGKWNQIAKGRDHLAPVALEQAPGVTRATRGARTAVVVGAPQKQPKGLFEALFGGGF